jgi:hypothetical protein
MVAATHGRSLWVLDVSALRQMSSEVVKAKTTLFRPATATRWRTEPTRGTPYGAGNRRFVGENPPPGAQIYYSLSTKASKVQLQVLDYTGRLVRNLEVKNEPGLQRASWNLVREPAGPGGLFGRVRDLLPFTGTGPLNAPAPQRRGGGATPAPPGMYRVVLSVDGQTFTQGLRLENDPALKTMELYADEEEEKEKEERKPPRIDD